MHMGLSRLLRSPRFPRLSKRSKHARGFTLIELIVATVIIGLAVTGVFMAIMVSIRHSADPIVLHQSVAIAESYLQEIMVKGFPYSNPCPAAPGNNGAYARDVYANVCDYNGLSEVPTDQTNTPLPGLGAYTVAVSVVSNDGTLPTLTAGSQIVRVDVTVTNASFSGVTISGYRTNY